MNYQDLRSRLQRSLQRPLRSFAASGIFLCKDESWGISIAPWENCEHSPIIIPPELARITNFPWQVKIIDCPLQWNFIRRVAVMRTDVYPLLWIYVWISLQVTHFSQVVWANFMGTCNKLGWAKTPLGCYPSFSDFFR